MDSPSSTARLSVPAEVPSEGATAALRGAESLVSLGALAIGESAVVHRLAIERPVARRLMELGLLPGTPVEVVRVAPLGDPIEIALRGYRLSIRKAEAARIEVVDRSRAAR